MSGCFNVVHAGHVRMFEFARQFGRLTVGVNGDRYLRDKYGDRALSLEQRVYVLRSNRFVDQVVVFEEDEPSHLILTLRPRVYVKGPDYQGVRLPEQHALDALGVRLVIQPGPKEASASRLLE